MFDHKFSCRIDLSHPTFGPFWELANEIGRDCCIKPIESKSTLSKKRKRWSPSSRQNMRISALTRVANGRQKTSKEKMLAARKALIEAGQAHRINGAAA